MYFLIGHITGRDDYDCQVWSGDCPTKHYSIKFEIDEICSKNIQTQENIVHSKTSLLSWDAQISIVVG